MDVAGRTGCSPTVTATFGCDFKASLIVIQLQHIISEMMKMMKMMKMNDDEDEFIWLHMQNTIVAIIQR